MKNPIQPIAVVALLGLLPGVARLGAAEPVGGYPSRFRIAVSTSTMEGVNGNDARAAMKIWADTFTRRTGMEGMYQPGNGAGISASGSLRADETGGVRGDEYVLLVHVDSGIHRLSDLHGRSLILHKSVRTCLARVWLQTLLAGAGLGTAGAFFGRFTTDAKPAMIVLPVFFRRADAAIVTRRGFEAMCEMIP